MTVRNVTGNLFDQNLHALAHGCNTAGVMGAGIALEFRKRYPPMYEIYRAMCGTGDFRLGTAFAWTEELDMRPLIFCMATQPTPGPTASLDAIRTSLTQVLTECEALGVTEVGMPRIGAGLGGLDWADVSKVVTEVAHDSPVDVVVVTLPI
jgi:O-acetyl-ADP-ribose deacetylase (regulator of RNase III)